VARLRSLAAVRQLLELSHQAPAATAATEHLQQAAEAGQQALQALVQGQALAQEREYGARQRSPRFSPAHPHGEELAQELACQAAVQAWEQEQEQGSDGECRRNPPTSPELPGGGAREWGRGRLRAGGLEL
jgi:hypothetical protein